LLSLAAKHTVYSSNKLGINSLRRPAGEPFIIIIISPTDGGLSRVSIMTQETNTPSVQTEDNQPMAALRAPLARGVTKLDRSLFSKTVNLTAASVTDKRNIAKYRNLLQITEDVFDYPRISAVRDDPRHAAESGSKCLVLKPGIKAEST
jgi:hypothetical protein